MKICLVSREVAGVRGGGIGTYVVEAGRALRGAGHETWLLTTARDARERARIEALDAFDHVAVVGSGIADNERPQFFHASETYLHAWLVHQSLQALKIRFDYIEFADFGAEGFVALNEQRLFGAYPKTALGLMLHTPTFECVQFNEGLHRLELRTHEICNLEDAAIRSAPLLLSPSRGLRDQVLTRLGLDRQVEIVRYPLRLPPRAGTPLVAKRDASKLDILYFGRIETRKGVRELIDAFAELPELGLTLVGRDMPSSPYGRSLRTWLERRGPKNVRFEDALPRDAMLARVAECDVCILPSRFENWPNTCLEAMSQGRVVVGSVHGGMSEMIEDGVSGFHVDGRSPEDIVRVLRDRVLPRLQELPTIGAAAALRARAIASPDAYVARIEEVAREAAPAGNVVAGSRDDALVTIVIPFYRDEATIDEAVDSALAQSHPHVEVLIVDDGSPLTRAREILARQLNKAPRVQVLRKDNGGLSSARNHAIERAKGEFLLFLDADNRLHADYASAGVEALRRCPEAQFATPNARFFYDGSGRELGVYNAMPFSRPLSLLSNRFADAGAFFRTRLFLETDLRFDEVLIAYEDWALWIDLAERGIAGVCLPRTLYDYRIREKSMVSVDGVPNHAALVGLLAERHLTSLDEANRALLTSMLQAAATWGVMLGHRPLRYKIVDGLTRISSKVPFAHRFLRASVGRAASRIKRRKRQS